MAKSELPYTRKDSHIPNRGDLSHDPKRASSFPGAERNYMYASETGQLENLTDKKGRLPGLALGNHNPTSNR